MKKLSPSLIYVPLVFLIVFNIGFVLYSLAGREEAFFWQYRKIIQQEWLGLPLYFLVFLIGLVAIRNRLFQKQPLIFFKQSVVLVLLFFCAYQITQFPSLNKLPDDRVSSVFLRKHHSSLEEAADKSIDRLGGYILSYLKMDQLLRGKILIVPEGGLIPRDLYFKAFVHPDLILSQKYESRLNPQQMAVINTFKYADFPSFFPNTGIVSYRVIEPINVSETYVAFYYGNRIYFIPEDSARQMHLKT
ncbi:MAG: hypothetical protein ABIJ35_05225 [Acidobacteriota bacterium]